MLLFDVYMIESYLTDHSQRRLSQGYIHHTTPLFRVRHFALVKTDMVEATVLIDYIELGTSPFQRVF
jgi:hypothetical protein